MNLLHRARTLTIPARPSAQVVFSCAVVVALVLLEILGRSATSDLHDGLSALALFGIALAVSAWHKRRPLEWYAGLSGRVRRFTRRFAELKYDHGIDFRGTPPFPARVPPAAWALGFGLVAWGIVAVCVWYWLPGGWREIGLRTSYVLYLLVLIALWAGLLTGLLAGLFVPVVLMERGLRDVVSDSDRRWLTMVGLLGYLFTVTLAAAYLPPAGGLFMCFAAATVAAAWCLGRSRNDTSVLWRAGTYGGVYSVPLPRLIAGGILFLVLAYTDLVVTGGSGRILTHVEATDAMPLTGSLAALVAWTAPGLLLLLGVRLWRNHRSNPYANTPPTIHLAGDPTPEVREQAEGVIRSWGWEFRSAGKPAQRGDVKLELVPQDRSQATEFDPRWPLAVSLEDLREGSVRDRLARRDEIQLRRRFFAALHAIFKQVKEERLKRGGGYWFAPHWWFVDFLGREEPARGRKAEDGSGSLRQAGPSFTQVFGSRVRQHWYRILRGAQIDLIYVEDGIGIKHVDRVLRTLLEVHDMHGGTRAVDDHTFHGLPKVRVVVHELNPEKPLHWKPNGYRQPKYDELSRARVLHIFRDKGEAEEVEDIPFDFDSLPSPLLTV